MIHSFMHSFNEGHTLDQQNYQRSIVFFQMLFLIGFVRTRSQEDDFFFLSSELGLTIETNDEATSNK